MADFNFLQNQALWQTRQRGVNFGGAPTNLASDVVPPLMLAALFNMKYGEFLARTLEADLTDCVIRVSFPTTQPTVAYNLEPIPPNGGTINPAALRVLEVTYTVNGGAEYPVNLVDTDEFQRVTGGYVRRLSWFGPRMMYATRMHGRAQLDVAPGTATAGDMVNLTIIPNVLRSPGTVSAANGGLLANGADVPLLPPRYHLALVAGVVAVLADGLDMTAKGKAASERWEAYIAEAIAFGVTPDGGQASVALDRWNGAVSVDG